MKNFNLTDSAKKLANQLPILVVRCFRQLRFTMLMLICSTLMACATTPASQGKVEYHSFEFNALKDSPNVEVLDYRYGSANRLFVTNTLEERAAGKSSQRTSIQGEIFRGDDLYVKWRMKDSGTVFEDTVDLKSRLPSDIKNHKIYFIIDKSQLYVYLASLFPVRDHLTIYEAYEQRAILSSTYGAMPFNLTSSVVMVYPITKKILPFQSKQSPN